MRLWAIVIAAWLTSAAPVAGQTSVQRVAIACEADNASKECLAARRDQAFEIAQDANVTATAAALARVSAISAAVDDRTRALAIAYDRAAAARAAALEQAAGAIARGAPPRADPKALERADAELERLQNELGPVFRNYEDLKSPRAMSVGEVQRLLQPDQALVFFSRPSATSTFVWGITSDTIVWGRISLGADDLTAQILELRGGAERPDVVFGRARAHDLFRSLLGPVEPALTKGTIFLAPSGPLLSLPFATLVMDPPQGADSDPEALRATRWLGVERALVVVPHPSILRTLRDRKERPSARGFFGVGNPRFAESARSEANGIGANRQEVARAFSRGVGVNQAVLETMPTLENAEEELRTLKGLFNLDGADVFVGASATEHLVRSTNLSNYRVISFATHAILPQQIEGLEEPGLVFTPPRLQMPPAAPSLLDDGYLTASEAAALRLDADWVILSACNTAQGGKAGDEALSGLARAFIFAGARSLLVTQWEVNDYAAKQLVVKALANARIGVSRPEALRLSMHALIRDRSGNFAHPSMWAPYILVGG